MCLVFFSASYAAEARDTDLWNGAQLQKAPQVEWGAKDGLVQQLYYSGEPYQGKPTRVFAYYGRPKEGDGPFPAMVLLHGGGGKAFAEWAKLWAERGYVAIAMDLAGNGPDGKRLADGGPGQDDQSKFRDFTDATARDMWTYHAVADAMLAHSLLAAQKEVDPQRIGVTGISWGGYLTCIVAGIDERFKVAVPVYGCGFIHENSVWSGGQFKKMSDDHRARWVKHFDPSSHLGKVSCPILFVNGTNDFAYPLDSYQKSYELVRQGLPVLCITVNMPHGHPQGWAPKEIEAFVERHVGTRFLGTPVALSKVQVVDGVAKSRILSKAGGGDKAKFHYTTDVGAWQQRKWHTVDANVVRGELAADMPEGEYVACFFTVENGSGLTSSSPHIEKRKER